MSITEKKINNKVVKPIPKEQTNQQAKGFDLFPDDKPYQNVFICAKKNSGKTTTIFKILKECASKDTTVIVFCSTYMKDDSYKHIQEWLEAHEINNMFYHSIFEGRNNILNDFVKSLNEEADRDKDEESEEEEPDHVILHEDEKEIRIKKRKPKYLAPKYIFIFDDVGDELKNPAIAQLIKTNRHLKCKTIFSSQYVLDLSPMERRNIDYCLLFGGINDEKLNDIYKFADLNITEEQFKRLYAYGTAQKYNFLYINTNKSLFRKNFDTELKI